MRRIAQAELLAADAWIADGNYGGTFDLRFARADTVIVLQPPRRIWRYPTDSRPRLDAALHRHREHVRVVELRSRREAAAFLDGLAEPRCAVGA